MNANTIARIMARHQLVRADIVIITVFSYGHPETSITRALWDYLHGIGPAAIAAGRATPRRLAPSVVPERVMGYAA